MRRKKWILDVVFDSEKVQDGLEAPVSPIKALCLAMTRKKIKENARTRKKVAVVREKEGSWFGAEARRRRGADVACKFAALYRKFGVW